MLNLCDVSLATTTIDFANVIASQFNMIRDCFKFMRVGAIVGIIIGSIVVVVIDDSLLIMCCHRFNTSATDMSLSTPWKKDIEEDMGFGVGN